MDGDLEELRERTNSAIGRPVFQSSRRTKLNESYSLIRLQGHNEKYFSLGSFNWVYIFTHLDIFDLYVILLLLKVFCMCFLRLVKSRITTIFWKSETSFFKVRNISVKILQRPEKEDIQFTRGLHCMYWKRLLLSS